MAVLVGCGDPSIIEIESEDDPSLGIRGGDPTDRTGDPAADPTARPETVDAEIAITIVTPPEGTIVSGVVPMIAIADGGRPFEDLTLTAPAGVVDLDPDPARFEGEWDTTTAPYGTTTITARATDIDGRIGSASHTVQVVHAVPGAITGMVTMGNPVVGGAVVARRFEGLIPGEEIGKAETDSNGWFEITLLDADFDGFVLVTVQGGTFVGAGSGIPRSLGDAALAVAMPYASDTGVAGVVVSSLSSLAVPLAQAYRMAGATDQDALAAAHLNLAEHLLRPDSFDLRAAPVPDLATAPTAWPGAAAASGLWHVGLEAMAIELLGVDAGAHEVMWALANDLGDGVFDGQDVAGQPLSLGTEPVDADTTRWTLAFHTDAFVDSPLNHSGLDYAILAADDGWYTLVSTDTGPLYPKEPPPRRFDELPPEVHYVAPTPAEGAHVSAPFLVRAIATDDSPLETLELTTPTEAPVVDLQAGGIETTVDPATLPDGPLALEVRAVDASGNEAVATRALVADTTAPSIEVDVPALFSDPDTKLSGAATDALSPPVQLALEVDGVALPAAIGGDGSFLVSVAWVEGPTTISLQATDAAGNTAKATLDVTLDTLAPGVTVISPGDGGWVGKEPFEVLLAVDDAVGVGAVSVGVGPAVTAATEQAGQWVATVPPPANDGAFVLDVEAVDTIGHVGSTSTPLVRDGAPPIVESITAMGAIITDGIVYVGSALTTLQVVAVDGQSGVSAVCTTTPCNGVPGAGAWTLAVATAVPSSVHDVVAVDQVGNESIESVEIHRDVTPPDCALSLPAGGLWSASTTTTLTGTVSDVGVGGETVTVQVGGQVFDAEVNAGAWMAEVSLPVGASTVLVLCTDALGNATPVTGVVNVDTEPPTVGLVPTSFVSEDDAVVSFENGEVVTTLPAGPVMSLPGSCEVKSPTESHCLTPFVKYTHTLTYDEAEGLQNLPVFRPWPVDDSGAAPDEIALSFRFERKNGTPLTSWADVPVIEGTRQVPVAVPFVTDAPKDFVWSEAQVPGRIAIRAVDPAGNVTTARWSFDLKLKAPPLFLQPLSAKATAPYAETYSLNGPKAVEAFAENGELAQFSGLWVEQMELVNPHAVPVSVSFEQKLTWKLTVFHRRAWLPQQKLGAGFDELNNECVFAKCGLGQCDLQLAAQAGCGAPPATSPESFALTVPGAVELHTGAPSTTPLTPDAGGQYVIGAHTTRVLALVAQTVSTCAVGPPAEYDLYDAAGKFTGKTALHPTTGAPDCAVAATANDTATCNQQAAFVCSRRKYAAPTVVDRVTLDLEGETTTAITLTHRVPTFATDTSTTTTTAVPATWSSKESTPLPPAPLAPWE